MKFDPTQIVHSGHLPWYRAGTAHQKTKWAIVYNAGGMGDYINWTPAIQYLIRTNPHIHGYIITPKYFEELARHWLTPHLDGRFEIRTSANWEREPYVQGLPCAAPLNNQYANATGFHLFQLGFVFYLQQSWVPPEIRTIPEISGDEVPLDHLNLPKDYAVLTPLATADARRLPSEFNNKLKNYFLSRGITPVFLGKQNLTSDYTAKADEGLDLEGVLDLRERTTTLEAACIMAHAKCVVGLDNGLIHLASCSKVPVFSIFTSVDPALRVPPRQEGAKTFVIVPEETLKCRFCNNRMRFLPGFDFKTCLYGDYLCIKQLNAETLIEKINKEIK